MLDLKRMKIVSFLISRIFRNIGFPSGTTNGEVPIKEAAEIQTFQRLLYTPGHARPIDIINVVWKI